MREIYTGLRFSPLLITVFMIVSILGLNGCVSSGGYNTQPWQAKNTAPQKPAAEIPNDLSVAAVEQYSLENDMQTSSDGIAPVKVAILLPLSGKHAQLGQSMLNAAQMAIFDLGFDNFELLPKDTMGTPAGARMAAQSALQDGAKLVLGPIFAPSVKAARQVTQSAGINMISFSTDWTLANNQTYLIGFLPFDQVERVVRFASNAGYNKIGVLSPSDSYGNGVVSAYQSIAPSAHVKTSRIERISPQGQDLDAVIRSFSDYDARKASNNSHGAPFNAVLMPVGGQMARQVGSFLSHYDLPTTDVKRLGTGLMDDPSLSSDRTLDGTWFAAPEPSSRLKFERRYKNTYSTKPQRISSLAYDATALSIILARSGLASNNRPAFDQASITNANGFAGVDGIFRFREDGIVERGLAVLEFQKGSIVVIDNAPKTFQKSAY